VDILACEGLGRMCRKPRPDGVVGIFERTYVNYEVNLLNRYLSIL
jgi:hypothetical protein